MIPVEALYPAADRVSRIVKRYGWTKEDCRQEAWITLNRLERECFTFRRLDPAAQTRYASKALTRHCIRGARGCEDEQWAGSIDLTDKHDAIALVELSDLIASAPEPIREYMTLRCLEGRGWESTREALGLSNAACAALREAAADWLLRQYEGV